MAVDFVPTEVYSPRSSTIRQLRFDAAALFIGYDSDLRESIVRDAAQTAEGVLEEPVVRARTRIDR